MNQEERIREILVMATPQQIEDEVVQNPNLYPRVHKYKTLETIEKRTQKAIEMFKKSKQPLAKKRYRNEVLALAGKSFLLKAKDSDIFANLKYQRASLEEFDIMTGLGKRTEEDKKHYADSTARATALYYYTGLKIKEHGRLLK